MALNFSELQFPSNSTDYLGTLKFTPVDKTGTNPVGDSISLYLPSSLQIGDKVDIENAGLGAMASAAADIVSGQDGMTLDKFLGQASSVDAFRVGAAKVIAGMNDKAGAAFREATRTSPNPNTRAIFKQVNLRTFQFTFKMIPNNDEEAQVIGKIIKSFRYNMYPETLAGNLGYSFPFRYKIEAFYDGLEMPWYNIASDPCYLESLMSNYNPSSQAFMKRGNSGQAYFSEIDMSLTFIESSTLDRKSVLGGL